MTVVRPPTHLLNSLSCSQVEFSPRVTSALDIKEAIKMVDALPALGFCPTYGDNFKEDYGVQDSDENQPKDEKFAVRNEANQV
jgi:hypothetical protein